MSDTFKVSDILVGFSKALESMLFSAFCLYANEEGAQRRFFLMFFAKKDCI